MKRIILGTNEGKIYILFAQEWYGVQSREGLINCAVEYQYSSVLNQINKRKFIFMHAGIEEIFLVYIRQKLLLEAWNISIGIKIWETYYYINHFSGLYEEI